MLLDSTSAILTSPPSSLQPQFSAGAALLHSLPCSSRSCVIPSFSSPDPGLSFPAVHSTHQPATRLLSSSQPALPKQQSPPPIMALPISQLNTMHAAGIFSDMSVDGPKIGTLVAIVDRAKNLPNRKKMGKQDPYCAARLGKEAKKTTTDRRGGQTPRW